jgi:molecular chaperone DnaK (HSP70)
MAGKGEGSAIGMDLGTTYSCVGAWQHDRVEIIAKDQCNKMLLLLKVDFKKACDSADLRYLDSVMANINFPTIWRK